MVNHDVTVCSVGPFITRVVSYLQANANAQLTATHTGPRLPVPPLALGSHLQNSKGDERVQCTGLEAVGTRLRAAGAVLWALPCVCRAINKESIRKANTGRTVQSRQER